MAEPKVGHGEAQRSSPDARRLRPTRHDSHAWATLNEFFDGIPRLRWGVLSRRAPAFRTCGVIGYYVALVPVLSLGRLSGRSLLALAGGCVVCALSFFGYALLRRALTGREQFVSLEHVWLALAACGVTFRLMGVPLLAHLDLMALGIMLFMAWGRVGCTLVGCCHGQPSAFGIRYGAVAVEQGFPEHLAQVRLFPLPLVEAGVLALLGLFSMPLLFWAPAGAALCTSLGGYAIARFGLEGARGDVRPHWFGVSQARWMSLAQLSLVLGLGGIDLRRPLSAQRDVVSGVTLVLLGFVLSVWALGAANRREQRWLKRRHIAELRQLIAAAAPRAARLPIVNVSSLGLQLAVSLPPADEGTHERASGLCISFASSSVSHLLAICRVASAALASEVSSCSVLPSGGLLALCGPLPNSGAGPASPEQSEQRAVHWYRQLVRQAQEPPELELAPSQTAPMAPRSPPSDPPPQHESPPKHSHPHPLRPWLSLRVGSQPPTDDPR